MCRGNLVWDKIRRLQNTSTLLNRLIAPNNSQCVIFSDGFILFFPFCVCVCVCVCVMSMGVQGSM